jgi:signal transduction histidine kinase
VNLKRQIILLIAGILIIPLVSIGIVFTILMSHETAEGLAFEYRHNSHLIQGWLNGDQVDAFPAIKADQDILIELDGRLVFSSISELKPVQLAQTLAKHDVLSSWYRVGDAKYRIYHLYPAQSWQTATNNSKFALLVPTTLILFIAGMAAWILRSMHFKVKQLVKTTQTIARGDLSQSLTMEGNDEFYMLAESLESMRQQLKDDQDNRTRLLMGISHDLKTPLASIKGYVQAIRDGLAKTDATRAKYIDIIAVKSDLLDSRIRALIEFVKLETSQWQVNKKNQILNAYIDTWFAELSNDIEVSSRFTELSNSLDTNLKLNFDSALLRRALENLVSNAIKYSPIESTIRLAVSNTEHEIQFRIHNTGAPYSEEQQKSLFQAFYRADNGRNKDGMGLGLTVVEKVAQLHSGQANYQYLNKLHVFSLTLAKSQPGRLTHRSNST